MEWAAKLSVNSGSMPCPEITLSVLWSSCTKKIENPKLEILIKSKVGLDNDIQVCKLILLFDVHTGLPAITEIYEELLLPPLLQKVCSDLSSVLMLIEMQFIQLTLKKSERKGVYCHCSWKNYWLPAWIHREHLFNLFLIAVSGIALAVLRFIACCLLLCLCSDAGWK